ncbi:MAG: ArsJ-associated glyceraldehyde-3-phosphate dehydrogenase [Gammaproteobacteria bacterium]|nr:ArsJ-associated glyceraldehyde-3-phosphate dehydrogenase [Gammaproteobacteria bacterium]
MPIKVGINGFGRIGRLALRASWGNPAIEFVQINDPEGDAETMAHLLEYDSIHGRWPQVSGFTDNEILIDSSAVLFTQTRSPAEARWNDIDVVIECSGQFRTKSLLTPYIESGVKKVVVSAPMPIDDGLNLVMGVNDHLYDPGVHDIITAASCTTNCLAPVVKVISESIGIAHGCITTIHDITNTQTIIDAPHKDLRRARANSLSLIPTSTGSAKAIGAIFPELVGKLDGIAVRVPLLNASITDCVFEVKETTDVDTVNRLLTEAANGTLKGILGVEQKPLVSVDYRTDPRSGVVDLLSTRVIDDTQVKLLVWYDNEWGYANRLSELVVKIAKSIS